jgi:DNA-directed RNA polymerase omega subunit
MTESPRQPHQVFKARMGSKFQMVIAAAKRSKQIASEAKAKGLTPNQVARVKSKSVKPTTLALEELKAGKVQYARYKGFTSEITELQEQSLDSEEEDSDSYSELSVPGGTETTE